MLVADGGNYRQGSTCTWWCRTAYLNYLDFFYYDADSQGTPHCIGETDSFGIVGNDFGVVLGLCI